MVIRIVLPEHLRTLAQVRSDVMLEVDGPATIRSVLDALEDQYPVLRGTSATNGSLTRRPFLRFFACGEDLSLQSPDMALSPAVTSGTEPLYIIGAIAGR